MNYRHSYHAGSFTDVVKHVILTALMASFSRKDTPMCYIDTHAGIGYYDLFTEHSRKTMEYQGGIKKVIAQENPPPLIQRYLDCVHKINNHLTQSEFASLRYYPGSPMVARYLARPHDRIITCELQPQEYQALKAAFAGDKQTAVHHADGYASLKALLPPQERRGLVLIDPPYESTEEFTNAVHALEAALKRWPTGIYATWYPIKDQTQINRFYHNLRKITDLPILSIELTIYPDLPQHLNGTGMAIINPPWQFNEQMAEILPWLWKALTINGQGAYRAEFIK